MISSLWFGNVQQGVTPKFIIATGGTITTDGDYKVHTFTATGTFTITQVGTGVNDSLIVECIGGGGAGNRAIGFDRTTNGGAGGSYAKKTITGNTTGAKTVTVGAGGVSTAGTSGGASWFMTTGTVYAQGGNINGAGSAASCIGDEVYAGGNGVARNDYYGGSGGGAACRATGNNGVTYTAGGAAIAPYGGKGGDGTYWTGGNGNAGSTYGGGGGGSGGTSPSSYGGNGAAGIVIIRYKFQ